MSAAGVGRGNRGSFFRAGLLALSWVLSGLGGVLTGVVLERRWAAPQWRVVKIDLPGLIRDVARREAVRPGLDEAARRDRAARLGRRLQRELERMVQSGPQKVVVLSAEAVLGGAEDWTDELRRRALVEETSVTPRTVPGWRP